MLRLIYGSSFRSSVRPTASSGLRPGSSKLLIPPSKPLIARRNLKLSTGQMQAVKGWGTILNILGGAYIGGLFVSLGSLYFLYYDADTRQPIPFELSFKDQISAVKAINKDDVLKSPRYAVKHYRRLLIELAKHEDKNLDFDESDPNNKYAIPLIDSETLVYHKSNAFSNFYIDIVSRYAKALLAKGELDVSIDTLQKLVLNDDIFFRLGDAERLSQCARLLSKITPDFEEKQLLLKRSIDMIRSTFSSINFNQEYLLQSNSKVTDELISCLNDLAFIYAKESSKQKQLLTSALNIYLANLKTIQTIQTRIENGEANQNTYPLFDCGTENVLMTINEIKGHISEIMWSKRYRKNGISWSEQIVDDIYYMNSSSARVSVLLNNVLNNLIAMHNQIGNSKGEKRCKELQKNLKMFDSTDKSWYDSIINRFCKIIYNQGPLGILHRAISERYGPPRKIPDIEEFENEDEE